MIHSVYFTQPVTYYPLAGTAIAACLGLAAISCRFIGEAKREVLFLFSACGALFACRWPILSWPDQLNVDESTFIACALKARVDWVPWRGFDASTSGPLNCDILTLPALFGADIGYFSARVTGLCLIAGAIVSLYFTVKWIFSADVARLSILPPLLLLSFTRTHDLVHYSSEHFPVFLTTVPLAAAAYIAQGARPKTSRLLACALAGFFLGCPFLAKLQAAPIALAVLISFIAALFIAPAHSSNARRRELAAFAAGLVAVPSLVLVSLLVTGGFENAVISYYKMTLVFATGRPAFERSFFFLSVLECTLFWVASIAVLVAGGAFIYGRVKFTRIALWAALSSILLLLAALSAIHVAHHPFPHYLLFTIIPVSFCVANVLGLMHQIDLGKGHAALARFLFIALFFLPIGYVALTSGNDFSPGARFPEHEDVLAIARYAKPGNSMVVWAWKPDYYVKTKTIMGTRYPGILLLMEPSRYREYFRDRFMSDLRANPPLVFVDGVGRGFYDNRATQGMESYPPLEAFVREHYTQQEEIAGVRIFVAKDPR